MKKILSIGLFCILLVTIFSSHALAETVEFKEDSEIVPVVENMGVSDVLPFTTELNDSGAVTPYTAETPSQTWNLANKGQYNFSGTAQGSRLYTNYLFTGKNYVFISVKNHHSSATLKVRFRDADAWFGVNVWTAEVKPGYTVQTGLDVSSSKKYFLEFEAPSNFSGYIR